MILAWSITEVVRYSFYAFSLTFSAVPRISLWARYTLFFILYPIGAGSELVCVINAMPFARGIGFVVLVAAACVYGPGFYVMYTHMIAQRKRYLKPKPKPKSQ